MGAWAGGGLRGFADDVLDAGRLEAAGMIDPAAAQRALAAVEPGREDRRTSRLWTLVMLQLWAEGLRVAPPAPARCDAAPLSRPSDPYRPPPIPLPTRSRQPRPATPFRQVMTASDPVVAEPSTESNKAAVDVPTPAGRPDHSALQSLKNIVTNYGALFVVSVSNILLTPILLDRLGPVDYGMLRLTSSMIGYMGLFDLGVSTSIIFFVAATTPPASARPSIATSRPSSTPSRSWRW